MNLSKMVLLSLLSFVLIGCEPKGDASFGDDTATSTTTDLDTNGITTEPDPGLTYDGDCPSFSEGSITLESAGQSRNLRIELPDDPEGAPVLFAWHWLGGTASQIVDQFGLAAVANSEGVIVVAPDSCCDEFEWQFTSPPEDNVDLAVFDDALACLSEQYSVDLDRVWATGMSAGGLWTSYLTLHRAEHLAATAPLSGGTFATDYVTPASPIPVLLTWGGPTDVYSGFSFNDASETLSELLQDDGHFVIECVHSQGHTVPAEAARYLMPFLTAHSRDTTASVYEDGLPGDWPTWCTIP